MINHDLVNGAFEFIGGLFLILNIAKLYKDKEIKGVIIYPIIF